MEELVRADYFITNLGLTSHPEGGYYKETYRSSGAFENTGYDLFPSGRSYSTAIYYLLQNGDFSAFHKIRSDECWHHYAGGTLLIHILHTNGQYQCVQLGKQASIGEVFQHVVPAGAWFASEPSPSSDFVLTGCTVSPGFDFRDFEMARKEDLLTIYSQRELISRLCR